mgnify:CR=1 FL=1
MWLGGRARAVPGLRDLPPARAAEAGRRKDEAFEALRRRRPARRSAGHDWLRRSSVLIAPCAARRRSAAPLREPRQRRQHAPLRAVLGRGDGLHALVFVGAPGRRLQERRLDRPATSDARATVARFVGADPREHVVIFGRNTTEAINKLSYRLGLERGDVVLVSQLEHHSNDLPWRATGRGAAHPGRREGSARRGARRPPAARARRPRAPRWPSPADRTSPVTCPDIHRLATLGPCGRCAHPGRCRAARAAPSHRDGRDRRSGPHRLPRPVRTQDVRAVRRRRA